jgi:hypothetical protein
MQFAFSFSIILSLSMAVISAALPSEAGGLFNYKGSAFDTFVRPVNPIIKKLVHLHHRSGLYRLTGFDRTYVQ